MVLKEPAADAARIIPMSDLAAEYRSMRSDINSVIERVLGSGRYVLGDELRAFEADFADYCGSRHAVGVGSGTAAVYLALLALGVGRGDEVVTVANTDSATTAAITHTGASVTLVDTDRSSFNMDPECLGRVISSRTRAVLPVHLFGHPVDMGAVLEIAARYEVPVVEDAALAAGARYEGRRVGGLGTIGCFSVAPGKVLGGYGDGGMVVTDDEGIANRVRLLRNYGHGPTMIVDDRNLIGTPEWQVLEEGYNERLDEVWAAVLRIKLRSLEQRINRRRAVAARYKAGFGSLPVVPPEEAVYARHVYHSYQVLIEHRDAARAFLADHGIASRLFYNPPLHLQPAYKRLGFGPGSFPVTEFTAGRMLALPIYPQITDEQVDEVISVVSAFF